MGFEDIIGQKDIATRLKKLADDNRLPHAMMLCGPEGSGKMALAMTLAGYVLHTDRTQHPDLHFSFPTVKKKNAASDYKPVSDDFITEWWDLLEKNGPYFNQQQWNDALNDSKNSLISVGESDRLSRILMVKSNQGGYKISIIWLPEKMNQQCQNKILKLLEEPPTETLFIMVSEEPHFLLETIRSRVQRFDVKPIDDVDIKNALMERRGLSEDDAQRISRIAEGNWIKAQQLLEPGNESVFFFDLYVMLMRKAYMRDVRDLKKWAEQIASFKDRNKTLRMLKAFQRLTRENFMYNFGNPSLVRMTADEEQFATKFARFINEHNVIPMYELFQKAIRDISQNANERILFFDVAMQVALIIRR